MSVLIGVIGMLLAGFSFLAMHDSNSEKTIKRLLIPFVVGVLLAVTGFILSW